MSVFVGVVLFGPLEIPDERVFDLVIALIGAVVGVGGFVGDVDEVGEAEVVNLPFGVPVPAVVPLAVEAVLGAAHMKILRHHARVNVDRGAFVVAGNIKGPVVHDVVEIDADAKAVGDFHHVEELRLGAVTGADRIALVFGA